MKLLLPVLDSCTMRVTHRGTGGPRDWSHHQGPGRGGGAAERNVVAGGTKGETEPPASSSILSSLKQSIYISKTDRVLAEGSCKVASLGPKSKTEKDD